jgi:hypothetical protein
MTIAAASLPGPAGAQARPDASLRVAVLDPSGAVIVGARVTVTPSMDGMVPSARDTDPRGEALFTALPPGMYDLRVEAPGFAAAEVEGVRVRAGDQRREVRMTIAAVAETVEVGRDPQAHSSDPRSSPFDTVLGPQQIDELPDDADEMEALLKELAGPGAVLRVNGFRGGRLPPKDQIQQIRFRRNMFAADAHEAGAISIDILTRPGLSSWKGSSNLAVRHHALNARNMFAPVKGDERQQRVSGTLSGPLWRQHTSLSLSADSARAIETATIATVLPSGYFSQAVQRPNDSLNITARLEHALTRSQMFRAELQRNTAITGNLGVGNFDLAERGYQRDRAEVLVRGTVAGAIGSRLFNELRVQARRESSTSMPVSEAPAVVVADAFTSGGAQRAGGQRSDRIEIADDLDVSLGRHAVRAGVLLEGGRYHTTEARNAAGTFMFASLDNYNSGRPTTFSRNVGDPRLAITQVQAGLYVQDDIRLTPALTVSAGVRQEYQSHIGGLHLAPRAGVVWSPFKHGRTTFRGGAGLFFDWLDAEDYLQVRQLDGRRQAIETVMWPSYPDPTLEGAGTLPAGRMQFGESLTQPEQRQVLFGIEQQLPGQVRVAAMFMHNSGSHLPRSLNVNAPREDGRRPDPATGAITAVTTIGRSRRDAVSINLNYARPARRIFIAANYTLGRTVDESDGPFSLPANTDDLAAERGPSADDAGHRFMSLVNVPLVRGIRIGSSLRVQSASPYNITTGGDDNGDTAITDRPPGVRRNSGRGRARADLAVRLSWAFGFGPRQATVPDGPQIRIVRGDNQEPPLGGPGDVNAAGRRYGLEFYAQGYNLTNHLNATNISGVVTSPFFGEPTAAAPARRIELGWRLTF